MKCSAPKRAPKANILTAPGFGQQFTVTQVNEFRPDMSETHIRKLVLMGLTVEEIVSYTSRRGRRRKDT